MMKYILIILCFILTLTGCREVPEYNDEIVESRYVGRGINSTHITHVFERNTIELPDELSYTDYFLYENIIYFICGNILVSCDKYGDNMEIIKLADISEVIILDLVVTSNGEYIIYDGNDLLRLNADGKITQTIPITVSGEYVDMCIDKFDRVCVFTNKTILMLSAAGNKIFDMTLDGDINSIHQVSDNKILLNIDDTYIYLDTNKHTLESKINLPDVPYDYKIIMGNDYEFYLLASDLNLYGYNEREVVPRKVLDLLNSNIDIFDILDFKILTSEFMMYDTYDNKIVLLNKVNKQDLPKKIFIKLASYGYDENLIDLIIDFNIFNELYQINLVDYSIYDLNKDIMENKIPDIFISDENLDIDNLITQNLFTDLNLLMEKDEQLSQQHILQSALEPFTYNGILYKLPSYFKIHALVGKTKFFGRELPLSIPMLENILPEWGGNIRLSSNIKPMEMLNLLTISDLYNFVGKEPGYESGFEDNIYHKILYLCLQIAAEINRNGMYVTGSDEFINDKTLMYYFEFNKPDDYAKLSDIFGNDDITIKGIPSYTGASGIIVEPVKSYAISKNSNVTNGAWEFVKILMYNYKFEGYFNSVILDFNEQITSSEVLTETEKVYISDLIVNHQPIKIFANNKSVFDLIAAEALPCFEGAVSVKKTSAKIEFKVTKYIDKKYFY